MYKSLAYNLHIISVGTQRWYKKERKSQQQKKKNKSEYCEWNERRFIRIVRVPRGDDVIMLEQKKIETPGNVSIFLVNEEKRKTRGAHCWTANLNYLLPPLNQQMNVE